MKHSEQFKQAAIERYLKGTEGYKLVAREFSIAPAVLRRWVLWHRLHGTAGLTYKPGRYSADFKLSVLQHMWDNALSLTQVAAVFNVRNPNVVALWEGRYRDGGLQALERSRRSPATTMQTPEKKPDRRSEDDARSNEELRKELEKLRKENLYLSAENAYLKKVDALLQARQNSTVRKKRK